MLATLLIIDTLCLRERSWAHTTARDFSGMLAVLAIGMCPYASSPGEFRHLGVAFVLVRGHKTGVHKLVHRPAGIRFGVGRLMHADPFDGHPMAASHWRQ